MIVGVPKEVKTDEYRVAMLPVGVEELTRRKHRVLIQAGAGQGSGIPDEQFAAHGAEIVADALMWRVPESSLSAPQSGNTVKYRYRLRDAV